MPFEHWVLRLLWVAEAMVKVVGPVLTLLHWLGYEEPRLLVMPLKTVGSVLESSSMCWKNSYVKT